MTEGEMNIVFANPLEAQRTIVRLGEEIARLRAALDGAYDALESNDEAGAFLILKEARRALEGK
jgi:hypothetical protein